MPRKNIQIPQQVWDEVQVYAKIDGIPAAAWVRESLIARILYRRAFAGDASYALVLREARRFEEAREWHPPRGGSLRRKRPRGAGPESL
jgi:hypothetical protein